MLILLPPSEGKTPPSRGLPLALGSLTHAARLTGAREEMLDQLTLVGALADPAREIKVTPGLNDELRTMTNIYTAPAGPAMGVYTGVLYNALEHSGWDHATWQRARTHVQIASTVWGMVGAGDHIPAYRLPPAATLPSGKKPITMLRTYVHEAMETLNVPLVIDCRSGAYVPLWRPQTAPWYTVKVATLRDGSKVSVSHQAKLTRGLFVKFLLEHPTKMPHNHEQLLQVVQEFHRTGQGTRTLAVGVQAPGRAGVPGVVELVVPPVGG